jgi:hypothetical protein
LSGLAFAQENPFTTISNVRNQVRSATGAVDQRRNDLTKQVAPGSTVGAVASTRSGSGRAATNGGKAQNTAASASTSNSKRITARGKRDPFESIIRIQSDANRRCASGKKCLIVGQIELKGIVSSPNGMIAMVENSERKTYFLHENDPVFNGEVVKIERNAIIFRETVVDRAGRQSSRNVVKRLPTSPQIG